MSARALLAALVAVLALAGPALAAEPRTTLPDVEDEVMCPSCKTALNVAESPQAYRQREFIRQLVAQGLTKEQVKQRLVAEYGQDVLALPEEKGIGLAAYIVPVVVVLALVALAALLLPRWRRRAPSAVAATGGPSVSDAELRRLDEDLRSRDR
jgi:cytochrome c-type biogenesis protein CcmH/NrfF